MIRRERAAERLAHPGHCSLRRPAGMHRSPLESDDRRNVVPDRVFVVETGACADYCLSATSGIPCNSDLRSEVSVGLPNPRARIREIGNDVVECGDAGKIGIVAAGIPDVTQSDLQVEVWPDLPAVADIQRDAVVRSRPPAGNPECLLRGGETDSVAEDNGSYIVVQRIRACRSVRARRASCADSSAIGIEQVRS